MIWSTFEAMVLVDLTVIVLTLLMFGIAANQGMLNRRTRPMTGRVLIMSAVALTASFYLVDLLAISLLPRVLGNPASLATIEFLHLHVRTPVALLSLILTASGVIVIAYQRNHELDRALASDLRMRAAEQSIIQSETRFRSLVEQSPDSIYCFEFNPPISTDLPIREQVALSQSAVLVECNKVFAKELRKLSLADALGTRFAELDSAKDRQSHEAFFTEFVRSGYRLVDYEQIYLTPDGEERALKINLAGVVSDGKLQRMWGSERNILDIRQTRAALAERLRMQNFVADISTRLITASDRGAGEVLTQSLGDTCRYFEADRATLIWFDRSREKAQLLYFWNETGQAPYVQLVLDSFPWSAPQLLQGKQLSYSVSDTLPVPAEKDQQSLRALGVKAVALVPLVMGGEVLGACTFSNFQRDRSWSDRDMADLKVITELFGNVVVRIRAQEELGRAINELRKVAERLEAENVYLRDEIRSTHGFHELVGESEALIRCLKQVEQVSKTGTTVLIQGETGTGKELIARAVHEHSPRSSRPLVKVNCAALPANLIESELFGYEKGAFTGAASKKKGRFDLADGGTIFLDEIGDFPLELQGKLLRVLQEGEFQRLGGGETIKVDVRVITATNRNLIDAVDNGEFRADLYYRINTFPIFLPPLRERTGDVRILAEHFVRIHAQQLGKQISAISSIMLDKMESYSWPGNVRQLESVIQRALISAKGETLELAEEFDVGATSAAEEGDTFADLRDIEREHMEKVLARSNGMIAGAKGAAAILGVPPSTLRSKMKKLGVVRPVARSRY
ncbi:MAG: sigma 54-interacting transcriptional regulator [Gammaproteobacteria bacterium]|nr:sigma 54-interacting transcriptional regulator [Gammaproteobacteria bacterium]